MNYLPSPGCAIAQRRSFCESHGGRVGMDGVGRDQSGGRAGTNGVMEEGPNKIRFWERKERGKWQAEPRATPVGNGVVFRGGCFQGVLSLTPSPELQCVFVGLGSPGLWGRVVEALFCSNLAGNVPPVP